MTEENLTLLEISKRMNLCRETARRMFRNEPGVMLLRTRPGGKPMIRVPVSVYQRVLARYQPRVHA